MEWLGKFMAKEELNLVNNIPQSEAMAQAENYSCSVVEINRRSPVAFAVNTLCERISRLAGLPVEKRQAESKKLVEK